MATYKVILERPVYEMLVVYVDADTEANAIDEAMSLDIHSMDWELSGDAIGDAQVVYTELETA